MALDGMTLTLLREELNRRLSGARVDKITQPEREEIDLFLRTREGMERLLLSASPNNPRVHLSRLARENPLTPPMFCMLLRKHLAGGKFADIRQPGRERILFFDFDCHNELGDEVRRTLCTEIMGRHSNVILLDENDRILDAVKHIDETLSSVRQVLPGLTYALPPAQNKLDPLEASPQGIVDAVTAGYDADGKDMELQKALLNHVMGVSPIVCRELAQLACRAADARLSALDAEKRGRLAFFLGRMAQDVREGRAVPVMVSDTETRRPLDFSFMPLTQYGTAVSTRTFDSFSALLDGFYEERDRVERFTRRSQDILRLLTRLSEHTSRKLQNQQQELTDCGGRDRLRVYGDLLTTAASHIPRGSASCELENYYEEGAPWLRITLNPRLTAIENAQKYYKEYRKLSVAEKFLRGQIGADNRELSYIDSVFDELSRAESERELAEIRQELAAGGYLSMKRSIRGQRFPESRPLHFRSSDGFDIYVGRNNRQNDRLTLKTAAKSDIWLHTRNIPGAHVIVAARGGAVPARTMTEATQLAALHSRAGQSRQVPVDYTLVKNVKKPPGAKPGMVIYESFRTATANPDPGLAERLRLSEP